MNGCACLKTPLSGRGCGAAPIRSLAAVFAVLLLSLPTIVTDRARAEDAVRSPWKQEVPSPISLVGAADHGRGSKLRLEPELYRILKQRREVKITGFSLTPERTVDLELEKFAVFDNRTQFVAGTASGDVPLPPPDVVTLRGTVAGHPRSEVFLGLSPHGCNGFLNLEDERYILAAAPGRDTQGEQMDCAIYKQNSIAWAPASPDWCQAEVTLPEVPSPPRPRSGEGSRPYVWKIGDVAVDTDAEFCDSLFGGNIAAAQAYIVELWAAVSTVYERDLQVKLWVPYARIWTGSDPWSEPFDLGELRDYWVANMDHIDRTVVHVFLGEGPLGGGAWGGLCDYFNGYGVSRLLGSFPYPVQTGPDSWDVQIAMHELGHEFGSPHTHCYDPPIDHCFNCESCDTTCVGHPSDCEDCLDCTDACYHGPIECTFGTIMSYCDMCSPQGIANKDLRFHERAIELIRQHVDQAACMDLALDPVYVDWANTGFENGTAAYPFNEIMEGARIVIPGGSVIIQEGNYPETPLIRYPMTLEHQGAPGTAVIIGE